MDEMYLLGAVRCVEMNPVRAGLVNRPWDYPWSSARAHLSGADDRLVRMRPMLEMVDDWESFLLKDSEEEEVELLRSHERTGRPLGAKVFVQTLEKATGRVLHRQRPGPRRLR
jgi:putative transposase